MMKEFDTVSEVEAFLEPLTQEDKWIISVGQAATGKFTIHWLERKNYTAHDGKEYLDEIWVTEAEEALLIQDLTPDHAKNIIRMIIRQEREARYRMHALIDTITEGLGDIDMLTESGDDFENPVSRTLH